MMDPTSITSACQVQSTSACQVQSGYFPKKTLVKAALAINNITASNLPSVEHHDGDDHLGLGTRTQNPKVFALHQAKFPDKFMDEQFQRDSRESSPAYGMNAISNHIHSR